MTDATPPSTLAPVETGFMSRDPKDVLKEATEKARLLKQVVTKAKLALKIGGDREHLRFEAWQTLGQFYLVESAIEWTRPLLAEDGGKVGYEARATVMHLPTGRVITAAEAECRKDEANWRNKPDFQLRSMAQTRACAKALRNVLAWVVVLAGYSPTPAEEADGSPTSVGANGNADKPVTPQQQTAIRSLWTARHKLDKDALEPWLTAQHPHGLTATSASRVIEYLQGAKVDELAEQLEALAAGQQPLAGVRS